MDLHQIQVIYQAEEDRLLCRASFKGEDGSLQEIRTWLTRRLLKVFWPGIADALEKQVALDKPQAAHASADIVGMEHHASLETLKESGSYGNPYQNNAQTFPFGNVPILIQQVQFIQNPAQPICINLVSAQGHRLEIRFTLTMLHGFCSLLKDAVKQAEWDLRLAMPGSSTLPTMAMALN